MTYFFEQLNQYSNNIACIEGDEALTYAQLQEMVEQRKSQINMALTSAPDAQQVKKHVIAIAAINSKATLINYLAVLQLRHVVVFMNLVDVEASPKGVLSESGEKTMAENEIVRQFMPALILQEKRLFSLPLSPALVKDKSVSSFRKAHIRNDVALMLSTSGSTGECKQVVLSYTNIQSNCSAICAYLPITSNDTTITTLPFNYSYGLSIINTHLACGACIVFTQLSLLQREFWQLFERHNVTSFGGVPHSYDMLFRLKFTTMQLPSLRYFTQAGGKLATSKVEALAKFSTQHDMAFFVMYGQTEATARMSFVAPEVLLNKPNTIGKAIPNSKISIIDQKGAQIKQAQQEGELVFSGDSVMLGYANSMNDLSDFPALSSLRTGDIGYFDDDGDLYISGRIKRIVKLFGERISLDQVELLVSKTMLTEFDFEQKVAVIGTDKRLIIVLEISAFNTGKQNISDEEARLEQLMQGIKKSLQTSAGIHPSALKIVTLPAIPTTNNGKTDYNALNSRFVMGEV